MTDRYSSLTVVFDKDVREDDARGLMDAIRHLRGVISVEGNVVSVTDYVAQARVRQQVHNKLVEALYPNDINGQQNAR